jgi:hypothetical protein
MTRLRRLTEAERMIRAAAAEARALTTEEIEAAREIKFVIDRLIWASHKEVGND